MRQIDLVAFLNVASCFSATAFTKQPSWRHPKKQLHPLYSSSQPPDEEISVIGVVAPLNYVGPYACLKLDFPHLKGKKQNDEDVSVNFVLDTGANVNSISKDLAKDLELPVIVPKEDISALGSAGPGGAFQPGDLVTLGDCQLADMPEDQKNVTFMRNLTVAALDLGIASSVGDGLLGTFFFASFPAGVEFDWHGTDGDPPTMVFYYGTALPENAKKKAIRVPLGQSFFGVPSIIVNLNGVDLRAIIDTGSPITIISPDVAEKLGIASESSSQKDIQIKGIDDETLGLSRSSRGVSVAIETIQLGNIETICIGNLPGLSLVNDLSSSPGPQVLLGLDVLRRTYRMILRLPQNEVWFETFPGDK